jgi:hypothetical protein
MAGDWIKMRTELQTHPKVAKLVRILSAKCPQLFPTPMDKFRIIGGLHAVWSVFDAHSDEGPLHGYTPETLGDMIGFPGLPEAMMEINWLAFDGKEMLTIPEFTEHNGASGKRRAEDQKRKRNSRKSSPQSVRTNADKTRTKSGPEREKIRDIKKPTVSFTEDDKRLAEFVWQKVQQAAPKAKPPNIEKWAHTVRLMRDQDGLTHREIADVFVWANKDEFWRLNILSIEKLRKQFAQLSAKREASHAPGKQNARQSVTDRANAALDAVLGPNSGSGQVLEGSATRVDEHAAAD